MTTKLISLEVLGDRLGGISRSNITRKIKSGDIQPPIRIGSRLFWDEADVDAMIAAMKAKSA